MTGSDAEWGELASHDDELAERWDTFRPLPDPGDNDALDAFVASKHLSIPALVRVGARLADELTLVFGFPDGLKFRKLETGKKWNQIGSTFAKLKIVRAGHEPADDVIVAEGETDAARLTALYPACDVAVMPLGAKTWKPGYAAQLGPYARVIVALDDDAAGDVGFEKIHAALPRATRLLAPDNPDHDWCGLPADVVPPPLPEPEAGALVVGGITFTELDLDTPVPPPEILVDDLLYDEGVHMLSGKPGCGKTTLAAYLALDVIADKDRHVIWLDFESGLPQTLRRFQAMDAPVDLIRERLHYALWPPKAETALAAFAAQWPGALVILDSMSKALSQAGVDENDNSQVTKWTAQILQACKSLGLPVVVIDHISKAGGNSEYSRGAGAKHADVDVHWRVEKKEEFNRTQAGKIEVALTKDREGYLPFHQWWQVGDGAGNLVLLPLESAEDEVKSGAPAI